MMITRIALTCGLALLASTGAAAGAGEEEGREPSFVLSTVESAAVERKLPAPRAETSDAPSEPIDCFYEANRHEPACQERAPRRQARSHPGGGADGAADSRR